MPFRHSLNHLAKFAPLALLFLPLLVIAQGYYPGAGQIVNMDGETFPPENPAEKAEWTFARFHYNLDNQSAASVFSVGPRTT